MVHVRLLLLATFLLIGASAAATSCASAAEWPANRQFTLVEPQAVLHLQPPPSSLAETKDGALLVLVYWPQVQRSEGSETEVARTPLLRIAPDGTRTFVPPFSTLDPGVDDEVLPLPDGSILFTLYNEIDRLRPDGSIVRFAGTGRYSEQSSGDGGPATKADIGFAHGLTRFPDGSIVFGGYHQVRRVGPDGIITTVAGSGEYGFAGDGGPATKAQFRFPSDVLRTEDGGFLIADTFNGRVRRVDAHGVITTIAGTDQGDAFPPASSGDGGPATAAALDLPEYLGRLPDGSLVIGEEQRIRRVSPDGTISTIFDIQKVHGDRLGDFAGRYAYTIEDMHVTREGGIALIVGGAHLRALYLAPRHTRRTLVALHGSRVSERRVKVNVDTTTAGRLRLQVRRGGRMVAAVTRHLRSGRHVIAVAGHFARAYHDVRVTLSADRGGGYRDDLRSVFTSRTLPARIAPTPGVEETRACKRIDARRIDCEIHDPESEESGQACLNTSAYRLFRSGLLFIRPYGPPCHHTPIPFDRTPSWTGPWRAAAAQ